MRNRRRFWSTNETVVYWHMSLRRYDLPYETRRRRTLNKKNVKKQPWPLKTSGDLFGRSDETARAELPEGSALFRDSASQRIHIGGPVAQPKPGRGIGGIWDKGFTGK